MYYYVVTSVLYPFSFSDCGFNFMLAGKPHVDRLLNSPEAGTNWLNDWTITRITTVIWNLVGRTFRSSAAELCCNQAILCSGLPYDHGSVMHYPPVPRHGSCRNTNADSTAYHARDKRMQHVIGQRYGFSFLDYKQVKPGPKSKPEPKPKPKLHSWA